MKHTPRLDAVMTASMAVAVAVTVHAGLTWIAAVCGFAAGLWANDLVRALIRGPDTVAPTENEHLAGCKDDAPPLCTSCPVRGPDETRTHYISRVRAHRGLPDEDTITDPPKEGLEG